MTRCLSRRVPGRDEATHLSRRALRGNWMRPRRAAEEIENFELDLEVSAAERLPELRAIHPACDV